MSKAQLGFTVSLAVRITSADWEALGEKKAQNTDIGPAVITLLVQRCLTE